MNKLKITTWSLRHFFKLIFFLLFFSQTSNTHAELEVLDDKTLDEQTGKEGITIDLSFKLSIGQIYTDYFDRDQKESKTIQLTPPPPRIEYHSGKN